MATSGSYDRYAHRDADAEIQRLAAQARSGWQKEARVLAWFGVQDGMNVLELGSGPGFMTEKLLTLLPNSPITCLEIDASLLAMAQTHLQDKGAERVRFVEGSVLQIDLEENQFDVAYARLIFQHLADPLTAAREILRVLKPGGKLIINDVDDGLFGVFEPAIPEFEIVLETFGQAQAARGGDRRIGRRLWWILREAGFGEFDLEVLASDSAEIGVAPFLMHIDPDRLTGLVEVGLLSAPELETFRVARQRFMELPDAYTLWLSLMVCARKPQN